MKALLKKGDELYLALLVYRSTLLSNGLSPADLLMNRKLIGRMSLVPEKLGNLMFNIGSLIVVDWEEE